MHSSSVEPHPSGRFAPDVGDPLDRLAMRLARAVRGRMNGDATAPIAIAELYHTLLPPRTTATELGLAGDPIAYDLLLMRLLSGERGYVVGDPALQRSLAAELARPTPDSTAYRAYSRAQVTLSPRALDLLDEASVCRCCGGRLPTARQVRFCPACGEDLGVQRCPACSTECEVGWHYCITCGRGLHDDD